MIPVAFAAQAAGGPAEMRFACAKKDGGLMRYVKRAGECRSSAERLIRFRDGGQVVACAHQGGYVYRAGKRAACKSKRHAPSLTLVLPNRMENSFCAHKQSGLLRSTRHIPYDTPRPQVFKSACRPDEKRVFVDERNRRPRAEDDSATVGEDGAGSIQVLANDGDPDGDSLEVARVIPGAIRGSVAIAADRGSVSYDPSGRFEALGAGARATETFDYKATDGRRKDRARVTVTVQGANDAPRAAADAGSTNEDTATTIAVLANDSDPDQGDALSVTAVDTTGTAGALAINPDGTLRYNPAGRLDDLRAGEQRIDRFAYRISDGHGGTAGATVSMTVAGVNDAVTINTTDGALAYTEGDGPILLDDAMTVADPDDASLEGARVRISAGHQAADELAFADQNGITGAYSPGTGVLTLTGTSSVANYQAALRSITFEHGGDSPAAAKTVEFRADDGDGLGPAATRAITVDGVNDAPTDISLTPSSVEEGMAVGTTVGTLAATDPDAGDTFTFSLASGAGDDDNGSFTISGTSLQTGAVFDFETKDSYTIRVAGSDGNGGTFDEQFTVTVEDGNEAPTNIALSPSTVAENEPVDKVVGALSASDPDAGDTFAFSLVSGAGGDDNGSFNISGGSLRTSAVFDFENESTYSIRVRATDAGGLSFEKQLTVTVTNSNDAPTDIALSGASVAENEPSGTVVGTLSSSDQDAGATHTYSLVSGTGDTDNAQFQVDGSQLETAAALDFEAQPSYSIRLRTSDGNGGTFEKQFTITATDVNDAPTDISLSPSSVDEGKPVGTTVGTLGASDQDQPLDTFTFSLATGTGDADNGSFTISGNTLQTAAIFNFNTKNSYSIRVGVSDGEGGTFEEQFTVTVNNINLAPTDIALSPSTVTENQPTDTVVGTLSASDPDAGDPHTFSLVAGTGDTNNGAFNISGGSLRTSEVFDFETKNSYSIRVRVFDGADTFEKQFTVTVANTNEAPTDIALANASVEENQPSGTAVGALSSTDQDAGATHTYALVSGAGSTDNAQFQISGSSLQTSQSLNFEAGATRSVRVRTTDNGGLTFEEQLTITVNDINDAPVADDESFSGALGAIGNTAHVGNDASDAAPDPAGAQKTISADILDGDADEDGNGSLAVVAGTFATNDGGSVTVEADGDFTFHPSAGTSCTDTSDFFDYTLTDQNTTKPPGTAATDVGRVTVSIAGCVWYVSNNAAGNSGTSAQPFDTLLQAETASGNNHTVFVFDGDNTSTGLDAGGYLMNPGERLIGEHEGLVVDPDGGGGLTPDTLHPANAGAHPTLTALNTDVIDLDDGNEVRGLNVDPQGTGGGIAGGAGDTGGGTIDDVNIADTIGLPGAQAGLELNGTTGTFNVTNLSVNNNATGVLLNNAGTTDFGSTTITSAGAPGLSATGTNMSTSTFDAITSSSSTNGGVSMSGTTGTTVFGDGSGVDLALSTASGSAPAFGLANAGTITVGAAGVDNVSANGGPAIDVTGTSGATLEFDDVDSTNSANDGINLAGLGTGTFTATSGTISGASGIAFDLDGGSGNVSYPGDLNNGSGQSAEITSRGGGAVTLSGPIADTGDAGGGISVSGNTGGSTTFSNASKALNTTTSDAVSFTTSDGHTLTLTNGLAVNTTSGQGIVATTSGTINVASGVNTVTSTTGRAVNVQNTDIGGSGFTFQSVSSNGAVNGILLNNTGTSAGMTITGTGANNSGGTIQNATQHGVSLTSTNNFNADELSITGANFAGVDGTEVTNFTFTDGEVLNAGDSQTDNLHGAIAFNDQVANENNVDGTLTITGNLLKDHYGGGVDVFNRNGTISDATVSSNTIDSTANEATSREDAISFNLFGSASTVASLTKAQIEDNVITDHPSGNGITILGAQTNVAGPTPTVGQFGSATNRVLIDGNLLTGDPVNRFGGAGIQAGVEGRGQGNFDITNNGTVASPITNVGTHGIATGNSGSSSVEYLIQGNRVNANNFEGGGLGIRSGSDKHIMVGGSTLDTPTLRTIIDGNHVRNTTGGGIRVLVANSDGTSELKVTNNDIADGAVGGSVSAPPISVENGSQADNTFDPTMCATISGNTTAANVTASPNVFPGIHLIKRSLVAAEYQFGITGGLTPSPAPNAITESFLTTLNPNSNLGAGFFAGKRVVVNVGDNFVSCTHPAGF